MENLIRFFGWRIEEVEPVNRAKLSWRAAYQVKYGGHAGFNKRKDKEGRSSVFALPRNFYPIVLEVTVNRNKHQVINDRLGNQNAVKRVFVYGPQPS